MVKSRRSQAARRAETSRALLAAASELFASRGYHSVSLDDIAARAGMTRGALHYNFDGKADLLLTLMEEKLTARGDALGDSARDAATAAVALPFDREASLLFLEFAAAAARDKRLGARLIKRLYAARASNRDAAAALLASAGADPALADELVHLVGAFVNGLSIEALAGADLPVLERRFALLLELLAAGAQTRRPGA